MPHCDNGCGRFATLRTGYKKQQQGDNWFCGSLCCREYFSNSPLVMRRELFNEEGERKHWL